jgi:hypothetical protein
MLKTFALFIFSLIMGTIIAVFCYFWLSPKESQIIKPFLPKTLFSIENAPSQSITGIVESFSGNVAWQSRSANYATLINSPVKLQQGDEINVQDNGQAITSFPNIVKISISPNTQVNFIQTLKVNFVAEEKQGNAFYEKTGSIPVSIRAFDLLINLKNGAFSISVDKESAMVVINVGSGSATAAYIDTDNNTQILTIKEKQKYQFNNDTKLGRVTTL